jgi:hypothetical protein
MNLYEIINPSDPYTFQAPDQEVATLTIFLLSTSFAATCLNKPGPEEDVPLFLLGGATEWWNERFDPDMKGRLEARARDVVAALRSTLYGGESSRAEFEKLCGGIPEGKARVDMRIKWNDENRSSLNDISRAAYANADALEETFNLAAPQAEKKDG